eukprot:TRINITY_DN81574_c0_g1_i1.p1 TRINITY_DN81574_c0_g1~~TRINITY_DN81574_c0_g1_i1.p1  ORF type:complete len:473 (+),score=55.87 TRINITY_DN81574_c0_g1_i1:86-1504(+)
MYFGSGSAFLCILCAVIINTAAEPYKVSVGSTTVTSGSLVNLGYGYNFKPNITIANVDGTDSTYTRSFFWPLNSYYLTAPLTGTTSATTSTGASLDTTDSTYEGYKITAAAGIAATLGGSVDPTECTVALLAKANSVSGKQCFIASDCATICQTNGLVTASLGSTTQVDVSYDGIVANTWYYIVATWKASTATLIVNGISTTASGTADWSAWSSIKIGTDGNDHLANGFITCVQLFPVAYSYTVMQTLKCAQKFDISISHLPTPEYTIVTQPATGGITTTSALLDYYSVGSRNRTAVVTLSSNSDLAFSSGKNFTFELYASFELPSVGVVSPKPGSTLEPRKSALWLNFTGTHACIVQGENIAAPVPHICNRTTCGDSFATLYDPQKPPILGYDKALTYVLPCGAAAPGQLATITYNFKFLDICTACVYESDLPNGLYQVYRCRDSTAQRSWTRRFRTGGADVSSGSSALCP